jgi:glutamyl-tRNA synthetase
MLKVRSKSLHDFFQQSDYFFNDPASFTAEELKKGWKDETVNQTIEILLNKMATISNWREEDLEKEIKSFAEDQELGLGKIIMPIRLAVCGTLNGPSIFEILELLGRDTSLRRIETALEKLPE